MRIRITNTLTLCLLISSLFLSSNALAQSSGEPQLHLHDVPPPLQVTTSGGAVGLSIQPSFSILDADDQVLMAFEIVDATINIEGESYTAVVQEEEVPWTVIYLVDTSRTLGDFSTLPTFKNVKNILATSVEALPDNSNIAVMSFASVSSTQMEFNQDTEIATTTLRNLGANSSGNTCMNDGLYDAINKLGGAPGRKAVILFTAGTDDCARRTPAEVVDLARSNRVQIYAVGLQGYTITQAELDALADPTGGLADLRNESALSFGISNVIGILMNQWTAKATVYPTAGEVNATLTVNLSDNISITSPEFTFQSSQDYIPPTEIVIKGNVQSLADGILFNLDIRQRQQIRQVNITIISNETGQSVLAQSLLTFSEVNTVPTVNLIPGSEYTLNVSALDAGGNILSETSAEFEYAPPAANLLVNGVTPPSSDQDGFLVNVSSQNISGVVKYEAWLGEEETQAVIEGTQVTVPLGDPILIPDEGIRSGSYLVFVQALNENDTVLAEAPAYELVYKRPSIFQTFPQAVGSSPLAISAITGLCCLSLLGIIGILVVVIPRRSRTDVEVDLVMPQKERRQSTPTPRPAPRTKPPVEAEQTQDESTPAPAVERVPPRKPPTAPKRAAPIEQPAKAVQNLPAAKLELRKPEETQFTAEMRHTPFTIGRKKDNDAVLPLDSSSGVSGNHLIITFVDGEYHAFDQNSTYGTVIDGTPVTKENPATLKDGSIIMLGPKTKIIFTLL
ncbi:MAG: FHA domain-containing protein [Anaerolineales bacterium]